MSLDFAKLHNVREHGSKIIARCPACAEAGMDETGEHLVIQADGRFGCVVHPGPGGKPHRQRIAKLAGTRSRYAPTIKVRAPAAAPSVWIVPDHELFALLAEHLKDMAFERNTADGYGISKLWICKRDGGWSVDLP